MTCIAAYLRIVKFGCGLAMLAEVKDKLQLTGWNLGRVNYRCGRAYVCHAITTMTKTAYLKVENSAHRAVRFSPLGS
jgi:hypothetical protein